jgi:DNA-binding response OmpR family regulator
VPTVLIADDEVDHRDLLTLALRRLGYDVVTAEDVPQALAALAAGDVDAVLTDVRMPGGSGIELCRRIRNDPRTESLPVMMVSADVQRRQVMAALQAGADDYLPKPYSRAEFTVRLETLMRRCPAVARRSTAAARAALLAARTEAVQNTRETPLHRVA